MVLDSGADYVFTEEIISKKLCNCERKETDEFIEYATKDEVVLKIDKKYMKQTILQLGTLDRESSVECIHKVNNDVCGYDINLGCGKWFSTHAKMGQKLAEDREKLKDIITGMVETKKPISCKIRLQKSTEETIEFIQFLYSLGITIITLHGRKHNENYSHDCDVDELKKIVKILEEKKQYIILNGDIYCHERIKEYLSFGMNVVGVMIGRASLCELELFKDNGKDFEGDFTKTRELLGKFIVLAIEDKMNLKKIKQFCLETLRFQMDYPFVLNKKKLIQSDDWKNLTKKIAQSKSIEQLSSFILIDDNRKISK